MGNSIQLKWVNVGTGGTRLSRKKHFFRLAKMTFLIARVYFWGKKALFLATRKAIIKAFMFKIAAYMYMYHAYPAWKLPH